jgi:hypothetical protein
MGETHRPYSRLRRVLNTNYSLLARNQARRHRVYSGNYPEHSLLQEHTKCRNQAFKPKITRALRENTCFVQEPISTRSATKRMVKILDAKYEKEDLPAIIREIALT